MDPGSEIFKHDPVTSMRAIASFFIPSDLIDACLDVWARQIPKVSVEGRRAGQLQNGFYQAANILFNIQSLVEREPWDEAVAKHIIQKYRMANFADPNDDELADYLVDLLTRISSDIRQGKGCASRALSVIGDQENLKYLSTTYAPDFDEIARMAKMLQNANVLIRLASKQANKNILKDLQELQYLINEELYEEI